MKCSRCSKDIPRQRIDMGYTICTTCSTEDKVSCHTIYPHKTGGYIQVVSKEQSANLNRLDRRGTSTKTAKHYKEFSIDTIDEPKPFRNKKCNKTYTTYDTALKQVLDYYGWYIKDWSWQKNCTLNNSSINTKTYNRRFMFHCINTRRTDA